MLNGMSINNFLNILVNFQAGDLHCAYCLSVVSYLIEAKGPDITVALTLFSNGYQSHLCVLCRAEIRTVGLINYNILYVN